MSRFPLREIAEQLAGAPDVETTIDSLLAYLRALQSDWHPTLAIYDGRREAVSRLYQREHSRLERREVVIPIDHLPTRLVRKFIRPSAFFNEAGRRSLLEKLFQTSPSYQPDRLELVQLQPIAAPVSWRSALCLPLNDRDELLGLLLVVSPKENAFPPALAEEIQPLRSLASLSLARRMHVAGHAAAEAREGEDPARRGAGVLQDRILQLQGEAQRLSDENRAKTESFETLGREVESLRRDAATYHGELERAMSSLHGLEVQTAAANSRLQEAYDQLSQAQGQMAELQHTLDLVRDAFDALSGDPDPNALVRSFVGWFCEHFQVDRCSLMRVDDSKGHLRISAHHGLDPALAGRVRVPIGAGVSGWVARNRRAVLVRDRHDASPVTPTGLDQYVSDSFLSVPVVHRNRMLGVLNLSNRREGMPFEPVDLERAQLATNVLGMALSAVEPTRESGPTP